MRQVPTRYSPVRHFPRPKALHVRLACVKHAASVRSEPGSNSQVDLRSMPENQHHPTQTHHLASEPDIPNPSRPEPETPNSLDASAPAKQHAAAYASLPIFIMSKEQSVGPWPSGAPYVRIGRWPVKHLYDARVKATGGPRRSAAEAAACRAPRSAATIRLTEPDPLLGSSH